MGVAEGAHGRDVDDLRDLLFLGRSQNALGAEDVGLEHRRPLALRNAHLIDGGAVDHRVAAGHPGMDRGVVAEVAGHHFATAVDEVLRLLGIPRQADHLVPARP